MTKQFSSIDRNDVLDRSNGQQVDLLVIGGGITGSGIALDAADRGMNVLLVEMQDYAAGTSSRSTKLVHGGLRYLKNFEVKVVAEVGKERAIVYENGPHVTKPEWMLLPIYKGGTFGYYSTSIGLRVYDFLAGVKRVERRKMLNLSETLKREPLLKKNDLKGSGYYVEYRTDDARLTIEVLKRAVDFGATAINYAKVERFIYENQKVVGATIVDQLTGKSVDVFAKQIVNATGPWVDDIRRKDNSRKGKQLRLTKGVHLVIDGSRFPLKQAIYFDTPDKRMMFAIPRNGKTYVGTTDTFYDGDTANPKMSNEDRTYIIKAINDMFPETRITEKDIESSWAGLRPLIFEEGKDPSEISRKDEIWQSDSGLITIAGGKLTGYRKMAELVVDLVAKKITAQHDVQFRACQSINIPISGGDVGGSTKFKQFVADKTLQAEQFGLDRTSGEMLAEMYGSNIDTIFKIAQTVDKADAAKYGLPLDLYLMLLYSIQYEMAVKPVDFLIRRTGAVLFNIDLVKEFKDEVINCMKHLLSWDEETTSKYSAELDQQLLDSVNPSI
ncbi:glycerol-3-phosphate dehydrogenase/oxidase [Paenibacillus sp. GSMTC-2017]|uniref:glycerol-3-phosphate dehydrogenase/oxidase n=1 Tax=Paenibacillus sp. GSMTC-2017 TaxID=2794350 RepID=UPI0018D5DF06|nr:glycerol-3-phosphate dehydrogenase/oxidase [Paenibacillus sp. GSMTC-2017]MBH5319556.1 glycerol-3-phosphate dehydrogenase/oxidase [Paenibacillus sp. GSMTC-2017]